MSQAHLQLAQEAILQFEPGETPAVARTPKLQKTSSGDQIVSDELVLSLLLFLR